MPIDQKEFFANEDNFFHQQFDFFQTELKNILPLGFDIKPLNFPFQSAVFNGTRPHLAIVDADTFPLSGPDPITVFCHELEKAAPVPIIFCGKAAALPVFENTLVPGSISFVAKPFSKVLLHHQIMTMLAFARADLSLALKKNENLNISVSNLINSLGFDFWVMDSSLRYVFQNRHSIHKWGNALGKRIEDLNIPEALQSVWKDQALKSLNGKVIRSDYMAREGNTKVFFESTISPVTVDGKNVGIMGITQDISRFKLAEKNLTTQKLEIEEANTALKVLLKKRTTDKIEVEHKIMNNLHSLVFPSLESMAKQASDTQKKTLDELMINLENICSSFSRDLKFMHLTGTEIRVANYIRSGKTTKEIADMLGVAESTVSTHRSQIRKKQESITKKSV